MQGEDGEIDGGAWMSGGRERRIDRPSRADSRRPRSPSTNIEMIKKVKDAGKSQNEMLFMRGNAMSGAPIIKGTIQLPKPPIIAGMTMKKIMIRPCAVVNTL